MTTATCPIRIRRSSYTALKLIGRRDGRTAVETLDRAVLAYARKRKIDIDELLDESNAEPSRRVAAD